MHTFGFVLPIVWSYSSLHQSPELNFWELLCQYFCRLDALPIFQPTASKHWRIKQKSDVLLNWMLLMQKHCRDTLTKSEVTWLLLILLERRYGIVVRSITNTRVMMKLTWMFRRVSKVACSIILSQSCCGWSFSHSSTPCDHYCVDQSQSPAWKSSTLPFRYWYMLFCCSIIWQSCKCGSFIDGVLCTVGMSFRMHS